MTDQLVIKSILLQEAIQRLEDSGVDCEMAYDQCIFKKFHRDEFYIIKPSDIIKDVLRFDIFSIIIVPKTLLQLT